MAIGHGGNTVVRHGIVCVHVLDVVQVPLGRGGGVWQLEVEQGG